MRNYLRIAIVALLVLPVVVGHVARASSSRVSKLPIHAHLSATSVHPGDPLTVVVSTVNTASLVLHVTYPGGAGFRKKGKTDSRGHWTHAWRVNTPQTGPATAALTVQHGSQHRNYTLPFSILPAHSEAISTPTRTVTSVVSATPTATVAPAASAAPTPPPSDTPTATPTYSALSTATSTSAAQSVTVSASVSDATPHHNETVTVYGHFLVNGQGVAGVPMSTAWHYKSTTSSCSGVTDASGTASCSRDISTATSGYFVRIDVAFSYAGQQYTTSTGFTPQ